MTVDDWHAEEGGSNWRTNHHNKDTSTKSGLNSKCARSIFWAAFQRLCSRSGLLFISGTLFWPSPGISESCFPSVQLVQMLNVNRPLVMILETMVILHCVPFWRAKNLYRETIDGKRDVLDLALFKVANRIVINSFHLWKNQYVSMRLQCKIDCIVEPCVLSSNRDVLSVFPVGWQNSTIVNLALHFSQIKLTPAGDWAPLQPVWPGQRTTTLEI